jgi:hypothetical protein
MLHLLLKSGVCCAMGAGTAAPAPAAVVREATVFSNDAFPRCCRERVPAVRACMFRIPILQSIPGTQTVLAYAEGRLGMMLNTTNGCNDGSGFSVWMRRSTDSGRSWGAHRVVATDTDPVHIAAKNGLTLGASVYEREHKAVLLFYSACSWKCIGAPGQPASPNALMIRSTDEGRTFAAPRNLTATLAEGESFIKYKSPLNVLKDTYDHSCY